MGGRRGEDGEEEEERPGRGEGSKIKKIAPSQLTCAECVDGKPGWTTVCLLTSDSAALTCSRFGGRGNLKISFQKLFKKHTIHVIKVNRRACGGTELTFPIRSILQNIDGRTRHQHIGHVSAFQDEGIVRLCRNENDV